MMKQWILVALVMALALGACLSMPVMAEQLIEGSVDRVETEAAENRRTMTSDVTREPLVKVLLTQEAKSALEAAARQAVFVMLGMSVPPEYEPLDIAAYREDSDTRCVVSLMPLNWELATDTLTADETVAEVRDASTGEVIGKTKLPAEGGVVYAGDGADHDVELEVRTLSAASPFYTVTFGGVDLRTGDAEVLGVQLFWLSDNPPTEREYSAEQRRAMVEAALAFAEDKLGITPGGEIGSGRLSGSFETGMGFTFALEGDDSLTVNVSKEGHVNGYSFIPPKG